MGDTMTDQWRAKASSLFQEVQSSLCAAVEGVDGKGVFSTEPWTRTHEEGGYGGGGITRILRNGEVFEQAGVNFSEVHGVLSAEMSERLTGTREALSFFAVGISVVIHPHSPMIPTTHANYRYLEVGEKAWFGGGADLTPYYLFPEDAVHFHSVLKEGCDEVDPSYYPRFKEECDRYFYIPHRKEGRGIGGIFYDYIGREDASELQRGFALAASLAPRYAQCYLPIVERRRRDTWGEREKQFQLVRRGRYIEFNLLYDRGTLFGLKTGGRIESIFMSFPPLAAWEYDLHVEPGSREEELLDVLRNPRQWV